MDNKVVGYTSVLEDKRYSSSWNNQLSSSQQSKGAVKYQSHVLLSQFIILPPYQGLGLGSTLL
jgi:hypothetical protein